MTVNVFNYWKFRHYNNHSISKNMNLGFDLYNFYHLGTLLYLCLTDSDMNYREIHILIKKRDITGMETKICAQWNTVIPNQYYFHLLFEFQSKP